MCESLLKQFYGNENLLEPTGHFEKCGGWNSPDTVLEPVDKNDKSKGYVVTSDDARLIFPKSEFKNAEEFYSNWAQASIPFMGDFRIQAVPDVDELGNANVCYKSALNLHISVATALSGLVASLLLFNY